MFNMKMKISERRHIAIAAVRAEARKHNENPVAYTVSDAWATLDNLNRVDPDLVASQYYNTASDSEYKLFARDWRKWRDTLKIELPSYIVLYSPCIRETGFTLGVDAWNWMTRQELLEHLRDGHFFMSKHVVVKAKRLVPERVNGILRKAFLSQGAIDALEAMK